MTLTIILMLASGFVLFKIGSVIGRVLKQARKAQEEAEKITRNGKENKNSDSSRGRE